MSATAPEKIDPTQLEKQEGVGESRQTNVIIGVVVAIVVIVSLGIGLGVGLGGNDNENEDENDDAIPTVSPTQGIPLFEETEFESICIKFNNRPDVADELFFGACFPSGRAGACIDGGRVGGPGGQICSFLEAESGSTCQCPEGLLVEIGDETRAELCNPEFSCPPVDLSLVTLAPTRLPTGSPTQELVPAPM